MSVSMGGGAKCSILFSQVKVRQSAQALKKAREQRNTKKGIEKQVEARQALKTLVAQNSRRGQFSRYIVTVTTVSGDTYRGPVRLAKNMIVVKGKDNARSRIPLKSVAGYKKECFKIGQLLEGKLAKGIDSTIVSFLTPQERSDLKCVSHALFLNYLGNMPPVSTEDIQLTTTSIQAFIKHTVINNDPEEKDRLLKNILTYLMIKAEKDIAILDCSLALIESDVLEYFKNDRIVDFVLIPLMTINSNRDKDDCVIDRAFQADLIVALVERYKIAFDCYVSYIGVHVLDPLSRELLDCPDNLKIIETIISKLIPEHYREDTCKWALLSPLSEMILSRPDYIRNIETIISKHMPKSQYDNLYYDYVTAQLSGELLEDPRNLKKIMKIISKYIPEDTKEAAYKWSVLHPLSRQLGDNPKEPRLIQKMNTIISQHVSKEDQKDVYDWAILGPLRASLKDHPENQRIIDKITASSNSES